MGTQTFETRQLARRVVVTDARRGGVAQLVGSLRMIRVSTSAENTVSIVSAARTGSRGDEANFTGVGE
jgi:hypothetical protein